MLVNLKNQWLQYTFPVVAGGDPLSIEDLTPPVVKAAKAFAEAFGHNDCVSFLVRRIKASEAKGWVLRRRQEPKDLLAITYPGVKETFAKSAWEDIEGITPGHALWLVVLDECGMGAGMGKVGIQRISWIDREEVA